MEISFLIKTLPEEKPNRRTFKDAMCDVKTYSSSPLNKVNLYTEEHSVQAHPEKSFWNQTGKVLKLGHGTDICHFSILSSQFKNRTENQFSSLTDKFICFGDVWNGP